MGWVYDAALRAEITARLGLDWVPVEPGEGQSDLTVVPGPIRDLFSERSEQVAAKLAELIGRWSEEHDGAEPDARTIADARAAGGHGESTWQDSTASPPRSSTSNGAARRSLPDSIPPRSPPLLHPFPDSSTSTPTRSWPTALQRVSEEMAAGCG